MRTSSLENLGFLYCRKPALIWSWQLSDVFQFSRGYTFLTGTQVFRLGLVSVDSWVCFLLIRGFKDVEFHGRFVPWQSFITRHVPRVWTQVALQLWHVLGASWWVTIVSCRLSLHVLYIFHLLNHGKPLQLLHLLDAEERRLLQMADDSCHLARKQTKPITAGNQMGSQANSGKQIGTSK